MSPRTLLYRATLGGDLLLLSLSLALCSRFYRLRHVPNPGPARADLSFLWFCVWIHQNLAALWAVGSDSESILFIRVYWCPFVVNK
jgi:hypothetical protein